MRLLTDTLQGVDTETRLWFNRGMSTTHTTRPDADWRWSLRSNTVVGDTTTVCVIVERTIGLADRVWTLVSNADGSDALVDPAGTVVTGPAFYASRHDDEGITSLLDWFTQGAGGAL